jgi:FK506-binding protein 15
LPFRISAGRLPLLFVEQMADDEGFKRGQGKGLAKLFGQDSSAAAAGGNESLQYRAPKQPSASQQPPVLQLTQAAQVQLYQYPAGSQTPTSMGRVGAALLGARQGSSFLAQLLLYTTPEKIISRIGLQSGLATQVANEVYLSIRSAQEPAAYSLCFGSADECYRFAIQLLLLRHLASGEQQASTQLDLVAGPAGHTVAAGDRVALRYTAWVEKDGRLDRVFATNRGQGKALRLVPGEGKLVRGAEQALLGMRRGSRRVAVLPPALGYGPAGVPSHQIPANAVLVFDLEIEKVKPAAPAASPAPALATPQPSTPQAPPSSSADNAAPPTPSAPSPPDSASEAIAQTSGDEAAEKKVPLCSFFPPSSSSSSSRPAVVDPEYRRRS